MTKLQELLKERYVRLQRSADGTTIYGLPLRDLSREDLMVAFTLAGEQTASRQKRAADSEVFLRDITTARLSADYSHP